MWLGYARSLRGALTLSVPDMQRMLTASAHHGRVTEVASLATNAGGGNHVHRYRHTSAYRDSRSDCSRYLVTVMVLLDGTWPDSRHLFTRVHPARIGLYGGIGLRGCCPRVLTTRGGPR